MAAVSRMNIEINNQTRQKIDLKLIKTITAGFLKQYKSENRELSIALVGDRVIRRLNREYRGLDKVTDVLSFSGEENYFGEIIIDYAQIKRQAKKFSPSPQAEFIFILVHGLLHLAGYDDKDEKGKKEMERLGREFIKKIKRADKHD